MQIGLPITGKYRDPESDQYYNNNNVRRKGDCSMRGTFSFLHYSSSEKNVMTMMTTIDDNYISFILCRINVHNIVK